MKLLRKVCVMAAVVLTAGAAWAEDVSSVREELADLRAKVASMESARMAPATGDCEALTSMKKKAAIKIGGGAEHVIALVEREDTTSESDDAYTVDGIWEASLKIRAYATKDTYLHIKLDLEDDGEQMEECYFVWKSLMGSDFGLKLGKKEIEFGMDKSVGYLDGFVHGGADVLNWSMENEGGSNPHGDIGVDSFPGEQDNTFAVELNWKYKDLLKAYATLFQNKKARGMHEDRPDDNMGFQSFAFQVDMFPLEGLGVHASFIRLYNDSKGDRHYYNAAGNRIWMNGAVSNDYSEADQYAMSIGADYSFKSLPLKIWTEYLHGWNWNYDDDQSSDTLQLGMEYDINESLTWGLMGEWAQLDKINSGNYREEDYYNINTALTYTMDSGIYVILEYAHQWYDGDGKAGTGNRDRDADFVGLTTGFSF